MTLTSLLFLAALLVAKHFVADFVLQPVWMVRGKAIYMHPAGLAHAGLHGAMSAMIFLSTGVPWLIAISLSLAESAVHYHLDWYKEKVMERGGWTPNDRAFWIALGTDQLLHHLTYLAMLWSLVH